MNVVFADVRAPPLQGVTPAVYPSITAAWNWVPPDVWVIEPPLAPTVVSSRVLSTVEVAFTTSPALSRKNNCSMSLEFGSFCRQLPEPFSIHSGYALEALDEASSWAVVCVERPR